MPLKIRTAEKLLTIMLKSKMITCCNLSYLCMAEKKGVAENKTVRGHFIFFARNQVIMICQNLMPLLERECFFQKLAAKSMCIVEYLTNEVFLRYYCYSKFTLFQIIWSLAHAIILYSNSTCVITCLYNLYIHNQMRGN